MFSRFWKTQQRKSVHQDWRSELPKEKSQVYAYALAQAEPAHTIFSIALNEALMLRRSGKHEMAGDQADVSAELCLRFAETLECLLNVVERHADNFGLLPSVKPLDPLYFRGETAKRAATMNSLLSGVLFGGRKRFLHKLRTLGEMACEMAVEYRQATAEISDGSARKHDWDQLGDLQYDLTTSLSEADVMLKSFIVSLPAGQVLAFRERLATALASMEAAPKRMPVGPSFAGFDRTSQRAPKLKSRAASAGASTGTSQSTSNSTSSVPDRRTNAFRRE
jgi:hypothetical protein